MNQKIAQLESSLQILKQIFANQMNQNGSEMTGKVTLKAPCDLIEMSNELNWSFPHCWKKETKKILQNLFTTNKKVEMLVSYLDKTIMGILDFARYHDRVIKEAELETDQKSSLMKSFDLEIFKINQFYDVFSKESKELFLFWIK